MSSREYQLTQDGFAEIWIDAEWIPRIVGNQAVLRVDEMGALWLASVCEEVAGKIINPGRDK